MKIVYIFLMIIPCVISFFDINKERNNFLVKEQPYYMSRHLCSVEYVNYPKLQLRNITTHEILLDNKKGL